MTLTNTAIDAMAAGAELKDDQVAGLSVRRHPDGWSWMLRYRLRGGDTKRPKLGAYPTLGVKAAREVARDWLTKIAKGQDPAAAPPVEPTVADLWSRALREHYPAGTRWTYEATRLYERFIKPKLGPRPVSSVEYADAAALHDGLKDTPVQANHAVNTLSVLFDLAEKWKHRPQHSNPCMHVTRFPQRKRRRYAKPAELMDLAAAIAAESLENPEAAVFLYLLMFSGARPSEIVNATPAMVERTEAGGGVLRLDKGKTGERAVFLPTQAMLMIDRLPRDGIPQRLRVGILGARTLTGLRAVPRGVWDRVRQAAGAPDLWARDLRRTFATIAMSNGVTPGQIGELLGHRSTQTTKIYAKLMEDPAHAAAAAVAGRIDEIIGGGK